jgi:DNA-binding Lrp family transcriptional regulator
LGELKLGARVMTLAFVMITAETGRDSQVLNELKKIEQVKEACLTYGVYDIVAKVEAETREKLEEVITGKIRKVGNVRSTLTMIVVEQQ